MNNTEALVKEKLFAMLETVIERGEKPEDYELYFGEASVMRATAILAKLRDRPSDDEATKKAAPLSALMTIDEMHMMRDWLDKELTAYYAARD